MSARPAHELFVVLRLAILLTTASRLLGCGGPAASPNGSTHERPSMLQSAESTSEDIFGSAEAGILRDAGATAPPIDSAHSTPSDDAETKHECSAYSPPLSLLGGGDGETVMAPVPPSPRVDPCKAFNSGEASLAVGRANVAHCLGGLEGIGAARVTFAASGAVRKVEIVSFQGSISVGAIRASSAGRCLVRQLSAVRIKPFEGESASVPAVFRAP